jgi:hypothetical protein
VDEPWQAGTVVSSARVEEQPVAVASAAARKTIRRMVFMVEVKICGLVELTPQNLVSVDRDLRGQNSFSGEEREQRLTHLLFNGRVCSGYFIQPHSSVG